MAHPAVVRHRTLPQVPPLRRLRPAPPWWRSVPWVVLLGLLAILRVNSQARLSELDFESRRLDRLLLEQNMRRGELLRERARLTSNTRLWKFAADEQMVTPSVVRQLEVGTLPPPKIYWELPEEPVPAGAISGLQLGQLPPSPKPAPGGRP